MAIILSIAAGIIILAFTKMALHKKNIYQTSELNPIINESTKIADRTEIKLFGGDLDFFGRTTGEMDENSPYSALKSAHFNKVMIICEKPNDTETKVRYGKILSDIPTTELGFYKPEEADLRIRGRIFEVQGSPRILMFTKLQSKKYKTIETNTADRNGALHDKIWKLVWSLAIRPNAEELNSYRNLYSG